MSSTGGRVLTGAATSRPSLPPWLPPVTLSAALALALVLWAPPVRDLAAQSFRAELFERGGFSIWNGTWYGGHYLLTYSILFPPLAALLGERLVGALSVVLSAYMFDRLVRERWGERARPATLWFGAGAVTMLASGRLSFALGVALGLTSLRALQKRRMHLGSLMALGCTLANPVAAVFLAGVLLAGVVADLGRGQWRAGLRPALAPAVSTFAMPAAAALALLGGLYVAFPGAGREPFSLLAYIAVPLWCCAALYVTRGLPEREFRVAIVGYFAVATLLWVVPNAVGGNVTRLGALFGGPALAAVLLSRRPRVPVLAIALVLAGSAYWQVQGAVRDVAESLGDPSTKRAFYEPLAGWLRVNVDAPARIEVPSTLNHWESAYLAPDFPLARGWLRQLDRDRNFVFYEGTLTHDRYLAWLRRNGIRYVALPHSRLDYSARDERDLILARPDYLDVLARLPNWTVYRVRGARPLVRASGAGRARLVALDSQSFVLSVSKPGRFVVLVRPTPYWKVSRGAGCVGRAGQWTLVRADRTGRIRVSIAFSPIRAGRSAAGVRQRC